MVKYQPNDHIIFQLQQSDIGHTSGFNCRSIHYRLAIKNVERTEIISAKIIFLKSPSFFKNPYKNALHFLAWI